MNFRILFVLCLAIASVSVRGAEAQTAALSAAITTEAAAIEAKAERLDDAKLTAMISNRSATGESPNGGEYTVTWRSDGTSSVIAGASRFNDEGVWRVVDGRLCSKWKKTREGRENCTANYLWKDAMLGFNPDGSFNARLRNFKPL